MTETTVTRYGHGPNRMTRLTFNEKTLVCWAKSLHISSMMEKNLLNLEEVNISRDVGHHIEERCAQIIEDEKDRVKI